jgi:hypothetical protein
MEVVSSLGCQPESVTVAEIASRRTAQFWTAKVEPIVLKYG